MVVACGLSLTRKLSLLVICLFSICLVHNCAAATKFFVHEDSRHDIEESSGQSVDVMRQTDQQASDKPDGIDAKDNTDMDFTEESDDPELISVHDLPDEMASSVNSAEHMLDTYFKIVQMSLGQAFTGSESQVKSSNTDGGAITFGVLLDFIERSLEVKANELNSATCFRLKRDSGCRKFTISTNAMHKLYDYVKERHPDEESGALTKRMFMEMAFYTYPQKDMEKQVLTMRFRELLFLLVNPSTMYELDDVDAWKPITLTHWQAFLQVHGVSAEGSGEEFIQWFKKEAEQYEGTLKPDHWEKAIEQAQGVGEEDLKNLPADPDIAAYETAGETLDDELIIEMDDKADTEHLLSVLHIDLEAMDKESEALLEDALHILQIYYHMIDLKDPNNPGFITKANFDAFIKTSLDVDANKYDPKVCKKFGQKSPCFKFSLNAKATAKLFLQEMNKMFPESDNKDNLPTFKMSQFQFVEMALQSTCAMSKVVTSFRRTLFVLMNPSIRFSLQHVKGWEPVDSTIFRNFLVLHEVSDAQQDSFVQFFEKITSDTEQVLDADGMEQAIEKARKASGCK